MAVKWGVIGAGGIAVRRTIPEGIMSASNATLGAVMDVDGERAREVAAQFGDVPCFTSVQELLSCPDVDAVYIATPNSLHVEQTLAAIEAGKDALVEKAVALSVEEAEQVADSAAARGVKLASGFMMRYHGAHRKIRDLIASGALGTPVMGRAQLSCWYPPIEGAWRQDPALGGGGSFMDMGSHCLDLLEMFFGKTTAVQALTGRLVHDYASEDSAVALLRFESGAIGVVDCCFNIPDASSKNVLEVYGSSGSIRCEGTVGQGPGGTAVMSLEGDAGDYDAQQQRTEEGDQVMEYDEVNTYRCEIEEFSRAIEEGADPPVSYEDGIWNLRVCLAVYESAESGRVVALA